ncbi:MAG: FAD-binding protein [Dehalococcoidia bacterium]|nr:FAD-binding protein [Dehalococcoidia bacterium]
MVQRSVGCDVLVIGGGIAGCMAAIRAAEMGARTVLASKGPVGRSGSSVVAAGTYLYYSPEEDLQGYLRDACRIGHFLDDQEMEEEVIRECHQRRLDMDKWGVEWDKEGADFVRKPGLGMTTMRNCYFHGGRQMMSVLRGEVERQGATILDRLMVTDLLTSDGQHPTRGRVVGAVGFGARDGRFYVFEAKATVLASGDWGIGELHPGDNTGDGQAAAMRAGAQMRNMDQLGFSVAPSAFPSMPGLHPLTGHGAHFLNRLGERFMAGYHPELMERAPRAVLAQSMAREIKDGRGPVYMDCRHLSREDLERLARILPHTFKAFQRLGIDLARDLVEYMPVLYGNGPSGGVRVGKDCRTTVEGLFCAGGASDRMYAGVPGLTGASVQGWKAGGTAFHYAAGQATLPLDQRQVMDLEKVIHQPLGRVEGPAPKEVYCQVRDIVKEKIGVLKDGERLAQGAEALDRLRREVVPYLRAEDYHGLMRTHEVRNIVELGELVARASLERKESRYFNYREDYPQRDDVNWLKWVIAQTEGHEARIWTEDIPLLRVKP